MTVYTMLCATLIMPAKRTSTRRTASCYYSLRLKPLASIVAMVFRALTTSSS